MLKSLAEMQNSHREGVLRLHMQPTAKQSLSGSKDTLAPPGGMKLLLPSVSYPTTSASVRWLSVVAQWSVSVFLPPPTVEKSLEATLNTKGNIPQVHNPWDWGKFLCSYLLPVSRQSTYQALLSRLSSIWSWSTFVEVLKDFLLSERLFGATLTPLHSGWVIMFQMSAHERYEMVALLPPMWPVPRFGSVQLCRLISV